LIRCFELPLGSMQIQVGFYREPPGSPALYGSGNGAPWIIQAKSEPTKVWLVLSFLPQRRLGSSWGTLMIRIALHYLYLPSWIPAFAGEG